MVIEVFQQKVSEQGVKNLRPVNKPPYVPQAAITNLSLIEVDQYGNLKNKAWKDIPEKRKCGGSIGPK